MSWVSERRLAAVLIDLQREFELGRMFRAPGDHHAGMAIFAQDGTPIPVGAEFVDAHYDHSRRALVVVLAHGTFAPLPPGAEIRILQDLTGSIGVEQISIHRCADGTWREH